MDECPSRTAATVQIEFLPKQRVNNGAGNDAVKLLTGTKEVREPSNYYRKPILAMQSC
jgi:hypothetical protein